MVYVTSLIHLNFGAPPKKFSKVRLFLNHTSVLSKLWSFFNNTSADFVLISADGILRMTTILKELRISQLCSKNEQTLVYVFIKIVENKNLKRNCLLIPDSCQPQCGNGGVCIGHNLCSCPHGFSGPDCQDKTCTVHCENGGVCTMPDNKCKCRDGYYGARCHKK